MFTEAFREAVVSALLRRLPALTPQQARACADDRAGTLTPLCRLLAYNETSSLPGKCDEERLLLLLRRRDLPPRLEPIAAAADAAMNRHRGLRTFFRDSDPQAEIPIAFGLILQMTVEEINSVLLSYHLQTVSWHRMDDLLLRYALEKRWRYGAFRQALSRLESLHLPAQAPSVLADTPERSTFLTDMNRSHFTALLEAAPEGDALLIQLHMLFSGAESSSNGAPRRALLKALRFARCDLSAAVFEAYREAHSKSTGASLKSGECPPSRAAAAYYMIHEAAGIVPPQADAKTMLATVNTVLYAAADLLDIRYGDPDRKILEPPKDAISEQKARRYQQDVWAARLRRHLSPHTRSHPQACRLILLCIARELPDHLPLPEYPAFEPQEALMRQMLHVASSVQRVTRTQSAFDMSCRASLFRLLVCCGYSGARWLLQETVSDMLRCFGFTVAKSLPQDPIDAARALGYGEALLARLAACLARSEEAGRLFYAKVLRPQFLSERTVRDKLSSMLDVFDPRKRNSEPGSAFLTMASLYAYGHAVLGDRRSLSPALANGYVEGRCEEAFGALQLPLTGEDALTALRRQLIRDAFAALPMQIGDDVGSQWLSALKTACDAHTRRCRETEIARLETGGMRRIACVNPLFDASLVNGGWTL